jgi:hypothetical protein
MLITDIEHEANEDKTELEILRAYKVSSKKELELLTTIYNQPGCIAWQDPERLR